VKYDDKGRPAGAVTLNDGLPVMFGGIEKMSKSKNNVVEPRDIIERFGADTARAYVMFAGPPIESAVWSDSGAAGVQKFLRRLWSVCGKAAAGPAGDVGQRFTRIDKAALTPGQAAFRRTIHATLKQALHDYSRVQYNTIVSACMKMLNAIESDEARANTPLLFEAISILLRTLYPIAPHITHALWTDLGFAGKHGDLLDAPWPAVDESALQQDEVEIVVQVNGKLRGRITVPATADEATAQAVALADENVLKFVGDKPVRKAILVRGKLLNLVV
jgi:leucyl-tRNA synthetase